jgi:hypothetical protein
MQEGFKKDNLLKNNLRDALGDQNLNTETDLLKTLEALSQKLKLLESKNQPPHSAEKENCNFKHTCYAAKSQMGSCPCELYKE